MSVFGAPLKVLQKNVDLTPELHIFSGVGVGEAGCVWQGVLWSWWSGTVFFGMECCQTLMRISTPTIRPRRHGYQFLILLLVPVLVNLIIK